MKVFPYAWELRITSLEHWRPCGLSPCIQQGRTMQVIHPVCCGIDVHAAQLMACLRRVSEHGQNAIRLFDRLESGVRFRPVCVRQFGLTHS